MTKKIHFIIAAIAIIAFIVLVIPFALNFILPIKSGFIILGGKGDVTSWLNFWGTYLGAIGSFTLGYVSYKNNKDAVKQNEKILKNITLEQLEKRFDHLESYLAHEESHYNESFIKKMIIILKNSKNNNERLIYLYHQKEETSLTSLKIIRFLEQEFANEYHNETGNALYKYGIELKKANNEIICIINNYVNYIETVQPTNLDFEKFTKDNTQLEADAIKSCNVLIGLATQVLKTEKKRIENIRKHG